MTTFVSIVAFEKMNLPCDLGCGEWWNHWVEVGGDVIHSCFGSNQLLGVFENITVAEEMVEKHPMSLYDNRLPYLLLSTYEFGISPTPNTMKLYKWNAEQNIYDELDGSYLEHIGFFGFIFF